MVQNSIKLTSDSVEFETPTKVSGIITVQALEEISKQFYNVMDNQQKREWENEERAYKKIEKGKVIEVTIDWPDKLDETNIKQINVNTGCIDNLDDLKALITVAENLVQVFMADDDDDCCSCC